MSESIAFKRKMKKVQVAGKTITFESGLIARQANGAVVVTQGETMIMSAACATQDQPINPDFFPLRVDYQENFSAAGKTLGGFIKRQGRPTQKEILTCRLIDRPLRPMFEEGYFNEVQLLNYVWSYDGVHAPEPLAICAASAALTISDIPLIKPVAAVRVGHVAGQFVVNPTIEECSDSKLDLILAGTEDAILMIEGYCDFFSEEQVIEAIELGHSAIKEICRALQEWRDEIGKPKFRDTLITLPQETINVVEQQVGSQLDAALTISDKKEREGAIDTIKTELTHTLCSEEDGDEKLHDILKAYKKIQAKKMRQMITQKKKRSDGRSTTQIRPIDIQTAFLPRTHGSAVFTRGETQSVAVCTLGGESMGQRFENLDGGDTDRFYLQYFFPPFSVGEVGRVGPAGRREVGHGKLAERALSSCIPSQEEFPYVIRIESNITESNGSSSMASVCGGCLAMMDSGVPIKRPVSGIAMGLILEEGEHTILSDILGIEDALGDMDFKITGDETGITAFQMDIKVEGITLEIMRDALMQAKEGRIHILKAMLAACPTPKEMSQHAPRIETLKIKPSKIGEVIGPGGKKIRSIIEECGVEIDINDEGLVSISSPDLASIEKAKSIIHNMTAEIEIGRIYDGTIVSVVDFGAFVEVLPGKEGLCHISEFSHERVDKMSNVAKKGDKIQVKVVDINERGQVQLSRRKTLKKEEQK